VSKKMSQLDADQVLRKAYNDSTETLDFSIGNSLVPEEYDDIQMFYTGSDLTSVLYYKQGVQVAEVSLEYNSGNLSRARRI
jgi:hypothetical protein